MGGAQLLLLAWLDPGATLSSTKLADAHGLPPAYLNKTLQALVRAGVLDSSPGPRGGFRLGRAADQITVLDVVRAVDGDQLFTCREIRRQGAGADLPAECFTKRCTIHSAMARAEQAYWRALAEVTIADLRDDTDRSVPVVGAAARDAFGAAPS